MTEILLGLWIAMNDHGKLLLQKGQAPQAAIQFRAAAVIAEDALGANHPAVAMVLRNLSVAYSAGGLPRKAEAAAMRSLGILESIYGPNDPALIPSLNALGEALAEQHRWTEARRLFEQAVRMNDGSAHGATALHNLGAAYHAEGQTAVAARYFRQALARREVILGSDSLLTSSTRTALEGTRSTKRALVRAYLP